MSTLGSGGTKWVVTAVVLWFVLSILGLLLPIFLGLALLLFVLPVISGYVAAKSGEISSIVMVSVITTVLAGVVGLATLGSVPPERLSKVTGIGWTSNILILTWVVLNLSLTLMAGYVKFRFNRNG